MSQPNPQPVAKSDQTIWIYLSYLLGWLFGLIGLAMVKDDDHIRFHCAQAFTYSAAASILYIVLMIIPFIGWILLPLVGIGYLIYAIVVMLKAAKGEHYKIPVCGDFAEKNVMKWFK